MILHPYYAGGKIERELVSSADDSRTRTAVGNGATLLDHLGMDRKNRRGGEGGGGGGGGREEQKDMKMERRGKGKGRMEGCVQ